VNADAYAILAAVAGIAVIALEVGASLSCWARHASQPTAGPRASATTEVVVLRIRIALLSIGGDTHVLGSTRCIV